jgi:aspartate carbamoyltransferase catalytic subunit
VKGECVALKRKDLLGVEELTGDEIVHILDLADSFKEVSLREIKKVPTLRGKTVINFFHEPSTRTKTSFEIAAKRLSADTLSLSASGSSIVKGETLIDTARTLQAMHPDAVVIRHSSSGAPHFLARRLDFTVINAGDGAHEHPTQALLDMLTIRDMKSRLAGLKVAIIGDILHSRVARSNMLGLVKMGARVAVAGPPSMMPAEVEKYGVTAFHRPEPAIEGADVVMMLRIQLERQKESLFPGVREYASVYGLNQARLALAAPDAIVMHPGPMNRGVEISPDVADGRQSVILDQVTNGVAVRMALLYWLLGGGERK